MIKNLLVPLDGSSLAESVFPAVSSLARKINISVTLIHVIETDAPETVHGQRHLKSPDEAEHYLTLLHVWKSLRELLLKFMYMMKG